MRKADITELTISIADYLLMVIDNADERLIDVSGTVARLHDVVKGFDLDAVRGELDRLDVHTTTIATDNVDGGFGHVVKLTAELLDFFGKFGDRVLDYDPTAGDIKEFAERALPTFRNEYDHLKERERTEPTEADKDSARYIDRFLEGKSMERSLRDVLAKYVFKDMGYHTQIDPYYIDAHYATSSVNPSIYRRAKYLLTRYADNSEVITAIKSYLDWCKQAAQSNLEAFKRGELERSMRQAAVQADKPATLAVEQTATPSTFPAIDFSHMESFSQTIEINFDGLYRCLKTDKVINNIDSAFVKNCIIHARLDLLIVQKKSKRNKLKYTFHILKEFMEDGWIDAVCRYANTTPSKLSGANLTDKVEFANKIKDSLKIPQ